jgi:hypothetical protein
MKWSVVSEASMKKGRSQLDVFAVILVLAMGLLTADAGAQDGPRYGAEFSYSFRDPPREGLTFTRIGPDAERRVKFEADGLRITLPTGQEGVAPNTGAAISLAIRGDFEITVDFEILHAPEPADTVEQTRFTLFVPLARSPKDRATFSWRVWSGGSDYFAWMVLANNKGDKTRRMHEEPARARSGRMRLSREGEMLSYFAADGPGADFRLVNAAPFPADDVRGIQLVSSTGGPKASLDVRVTDLRVRATELPELPALVVKPGGTRWMLLTSAVALLAILVLGVVLLWRRRRREPETSPPPNAT